MKTRSRLLAAILVAAICLLAVPAAQAADVFKFSERTVSIFAGDTYATQIEQDGRYLEGEISYRLAKASRACTVDENGIITGLAPGSASVVAELKQNGRRVRTATMDVRVSRKVTKVTMETKELTVYEPDDEKTLELLPRKPEEEPLQDRILVLLAGFSFNARFYFTPEDVSSADKKATMESTDAGVVRIAGSRVSAVQPGECDLIISSVQSPEVTERFHVLVIKPVKQITVTAPSKSVSAGGTLQLDTVISPEDANIKDVVWSSRSPKIATVDENGLVTGIAKGNVVIDAKAADGSKRSAYISLTVTQDVTEVSIRETDVTVATGRSSAQLHATVSPTNANNRRLVWTSSDETIATVRNGVVTGRKAGECVVTCASESNPDVFTTIPVQVIQMVTDLSFLTPKGLSFYIGESMPLDWQVIPEDATIQDVTFRSKNPKVAAVDQNGIVTGLAKGQADIEIQATDGSRKAKTYRVTILKKVEGIDQLADQMFAPIGRVKNFSTKVYPNDASNQRITWSGSDDNIATVSNSGERSARVFGRQQGWLTLTATTEDGGFSTSTTLVVDDFDHMIMIENQDTYIDWNNRIMLGFYNRSWNYTVNVVDFRVDCYDTQGYPMVCNTDGVSTSFNGSYRLQLMPGGKTTHGRFSYYDYEPTGMLGYVVITITGYEFENGQKWTIPDEIQEMDGFRSRYSDHWGEPTPTPVPTPTPEPTPIPTEEPEAGNG